MLRWVHSWELSAWPCGAQRLTTRKIHGIDIVVGVVGVVLVFVVADVVVTIVVVVAVFVVVVVVHVIVAGAGDAHPT
mgnify:CR=1 FL=1